MYFMMPLMVHTVTSQSVDARCQMLVKQSLLQLSGSPSLTLNTSFTSERVTSFHMMVKRVPVDFPQLRTATTV